MVQSISSDVVGYASGHDNLFKKELHRLRGRRLGLVVNQTSLDHQLDHLVDKLIGYRTCKVAAIFGPQHGIFGQTQDNMIEWHGYRDKCLNIPVRSLYGKTRIPTKQMLKDVDTLIFDIQDAGSRYYTFMSTLFYCIQACGKYGITMIVLDRPNPISATAIEGNPIVADHLSFVGIAPMPPRYGMTCGELALYFNREFSLKGSLHIVKMSGYPRVSYFDDLKTFWVMPSPNMPTLDTAIVYPGMCLLEGTNISEGRGTTRPFELFGAPFIVSQQLIEELERLKLPGCQFRVASFQPTFQKWQGMLCNGAQIHVMDRKRFKPYLTALGILRTLLRLYPHDFKWKPPPYEYEHQKLPIDILLGNPDIRKRLERQESLMQIEALWQSDLARFKKIRQNYLIYS